jgi:hypothetical protein
MKKLIVVLFAILALAWAGLWIYRPSKVEKEENSFPVVGQEDSSDTAESSGQMQKISSAAIPQAEAKKGRPEISSTNVSVSAESQMPVDRGDRQGVDKSPLSSIVIEDELLDLLSKNFVGKELISREQLHQAAVLGVLKHLGHAAEIEPAPLPAQASSTGDAMKEPSGTNASPTIISKEVSPKSSDPATLKTEPNVVGRAADFIQDQVLFLRLGHSLDRGSLDWMRKKVEEKGAAVSGIVVDLRYTEGRDLEHAAEAADYFIAEARPLLTLVTLNGEEIIESKPSSLVTSSIPLTLLVNSSTSGSAEVLASVLQQTGRAIIVGNAPTAGRNYETTAYTLGDGRILKLATARVKLPGREEHEFFQTPTKPDVITSLSPDLERKIWRAPFQPPEVVKTVRYYSEAILTGKEQAPPLSDRKKKTGNEKASLSNQDVTLLTALDILKSIRVLEVAPSPVSPEDGESIKNQSLSITPEKEKPHGHNQEPRSRTPIQSSGSLP